MKENRVQKEAQTRRFAVLVRFTLKPGRLDAFLPLMERNAAQSFSREAGCRRFDILRSSEGEGAADEIVLYEIYDSEAAFEEHLGTDHFVSFRDLTAPMIEASRVETFFVTEQAAG